MLGDVIRRERERRGWSQREFAEQSGLSQTYVSLLEKGERDNISRVKLQALAKLFDLTVDELLQQSEEPESFPLNEVLAAGLHEQDAQRIAHLWEIHPDRRRALVESAYRLAQEHSYLDKVALESRKENRGG